MPRPLKPIIYVIPKKPVPAGRPGIPNPIDVHLGSRLRTRRILLGVSQQKLGELLGLTFQQIQKYERGANRVGASRLWDLARVLDVPISYFFEGMPDEVKRNSPRCRAGLSEGKLPRIEAETDPEEQRATLELARAYYKIPTKALRKRVLELVKAQAKI